MKSVLLSATCLAASLSLGGCATMPAPEAPASQSPAAAIGQSLADASFEKLGETYIETIAKLYPTYGTSLGDHRYDANLPDVSAAGRAADKKVAQAMLTGLAQIDPANLSRENQVDYALMKSSLEQEIWSVDTLQEWAWNPQYYNDLAAGSLYGLVARDFAPFEDRYPDIVSRMQKLPGLLAEARRQIDVARVPKVHAETVAKQNAGILEIVDSMIVPEIDKAGLDRSAFDPAYEKLKAAVAEHQKWLDDVVVPGAKGDFRLGPALYDQKMRYGLQSDISRAELKARAEAAFADARSDMEKIARTFSDCDVPGQQAAIECALEKSYARRAPRDRLEEEARQTLATATEFTRKEGFVAMPDGQVQIITMPKFWQGNAVAYLDSPAPLERQLPAFYAVSPVPDDWSDEQATSFLKEYNWYMLHELSIHEGVPGHYLQVNLSNQFPSTLRAVLSSSPFVEGWAVYSERVMAEHDYLGGMDTVDGRLFALTMLKMRLRSVTNTLLDIGIHTEGMTREAAMKLMMEGAFQQEREAAGKWIRANLSSVQLLSYFTGYSEHVAMREEAKRRWGADYDERTYHDRVLAHGSPPAKFVRALIFGEPIPRTE